MNSRIVGVCAGSGLGFEADHSVRWWNKWRCARALPSSVRKGRWRSRIKTVQVLESLLWKKWGADFIRLWINCRIFCNECIRKKFPVILLSTWFPLPLFFSSSLSPLLLYLVLALWCVFAQPLTLSYNGVSLYISSLTSQVITLSAYSRLLDLFGNNLSAAATDIATSLSPYLSTPRVHTVAARTCIGSINSLWCHHCWKFVQGGQGKLIVYCFFSPGNSLHYYFLWLEGTCCLLFPMTGILIACWFLYPEGTHCLLFPKIEGP